MDIKTNNNAEWFGTEMDYPIFLCQTPFSIEKIEEIAGVLFEETEEAGLGTVFYSFLSVDNKQIMLKGYHDRTRTKDVEVCAYMHCTEPSPEQLIELLTKILSIEESDLLGKGKYLESPKYSLTRLDDNNNEIEIARFHDGSFAENLRKRYEDKGHKQDYYVQKLS